jgi:type IV pilus assembly protein PilP
MRGFSRFLSNAVSIACHGALGGSFVITAACSPKRTQPPAPTAPPTVAIEATLPPAAPATPPAAPTGEGRDPFAMGAVVVSTPPKDDRPRKSKRFSIDELKLVGIVSSVDTPRAMFVDPRGKGSVVTRGQLLGRAEIIHDGEGDHQVSWRVDRIRESEVVLVREDATHSIVPSSTKVLALRHAPAIADDDELED